MVLIDPAGAPWESVRNWVGERRTGRVNRITLEP
jgi:hypothetical protein